jgi:hypothetical protein
MSIRNVPPTIVLIADSLATRAEVNLAAGELDAARNLMGKADAGYAEIERRFPKLESNDERNEIEARLNRLRARLHTLYQTPHT